jgi:hypothetical protein
VSNTDYLLPLPFDDRAYVDRILAIISELMNYLLSLPQTKALLIVCLRWKDSYKSGLVKDLEGVVCGQF